MQQAAIDATRPGARFNEPHEAAVRTLTQGLFDLGILTHNQHGSVQDAVAARAYAPYYMHCASHWMGMDVHDCGSYGYPRFGFVEIERGRSARRGKPDAVRTLRRDVTPCRACPHDCARP